MDEINLRAEPSVTGKILGKITKDTILESDKYTWKEVTLSNGKKGYCSASYLKKIEEAKATWHVPIRSDKFKLTQKFLNPDPIYKKTGHHPGADYGTQGEKEVPLFFCADGEVIESGTHTAFGNYFFFYVASVDRTFVYFHLKDKAPVVGSYKAGAQCGITGQTGLSLGIHLHLECIKGKKTSADRSVLFTSKEALTLYAEDPDAFIRARL